MDRREELISQLLDKYWSSGDAISGMEAIADFILQHEQSLHSQITELEEEVKKGMKQVLLNEQLRRRVEELEKRIDWETNHTSHFGYFTQIDGDSMQTTGLLCQQKWIKLSKFEELQHRIDTLTKAIETLLDDVNPVNYPEKSWRENNKNKIGSKKMPDDSSLLGLMKSIELLTGKDGGE